MIKDLQWFLNRIGKRVYRNSDGCECKTCKDIVDNGILIEDEDHAEYMFDVQNDYGAEGINLYYRDAKEQKS